MVASRAGNPNALVRHWRGLRRRPRFGACALLFVVLAVGLALAGMPRARAVLLGFDVAAFIYLAIVLVGITHADTHTMRRYARAEDEGYWGFLLSGAGVATVALVALAVELHAGLDSGPIEIALAVASLVLSWIYLNTLFALHYAHEYYGDAGRKTAGLRFPGTREPDYWDFIYFAFGLGMTFQVSDVAISDRGIRHVVTAHSLIAFFFNVIVIALSVNVVAGAT